MAYTYNKPDATDTISSSQTVLKDNFTAIKGLVDINHATFGDPSEGKHKIVHFPALTVTPGSIPAATLPAEYALYSTSTGLFLRPPAQSAGTVSSDVNFTECLKDPNGWCRLPCGIIMQWGSGSMAHNTTTAGGAFVKAFSTFYSITSSPYTMVTSSYSPQDSVFGISGTTTTWSAERSSSHKDKAISFYWLALGV